MDADKVMFEDIRLHVSKVKVNPAVIYAQSQALQQTNAKYPFTQTLIKQMTIQAGSTYDNIFQGKRPNLVVVRFVNAISVSGSYEQNPWFFQSYAISSIGLYVDGIPVGGNPLKLKYSENGGQTVNPVLRSMLQSTGKCLSDTGLNLERDDIGQGYSLYTFDLEPAFRTSQYLSLIKQENVRLETKFGSALTEAGSCIIYCEYPGYFEINTARDVVSP
ncbi:uncharacterized protein F54H12.2-like [Mizuhopecten yessoensis]|uniref:uncharacterized protein F54H12.2-like n=1 Tax=Mizuhopecten yessoensis TaxID=6573 RepID=UPI000B45D973|nr:uncharacterized protein F54H12.2-like [Mizuhopecten yessoensis]